MQGEKKALLRGAAAGALGMLLACILAVLLFLPGYGRHMTTMLKLGQILDTVDRQFIGEADADMMGDMAAYGMMKSLDDRYSLYLPAEIAEEYEANKYGETFGVGVQCVWDEERQAARVYRILDGSSAKEQGIQPGDWLLAADGVTAAQDGYDALVEAVRGEEGTQVRVTYLHVENGAESEREVSLERRRLTQLMAEGEMLEDRVGLIRIFSFHKGAAEQFEAAYQALREQGMEQLVIDVRHNSGGLVSEMEQVADRFLPECDVMILRRKNGREMRRASGAEHDDIPLAVLADEQSYSAAEFFAALMQEYGRAVTVGAKTTGKERAQNTYKLADGSEIVLSDQQYLTPQGRALGETGMTPDLEVALPEGAVFYFLEPGEDPQLAAAVGALAKKTAETGAENSENVKNP